MIGSTEMILIFGVIILLFGANKLPELARSMGKATGEFKRAQRETELEMRKLDEPIRLEAAGISQNVQKLAKDLDIKTEGKVHE
ncbi:MAG: twin-arginine translocase TatA/TatE family subunit [Candidatus Methanoperedens sp.]|nr:twin-arginine translocase TatA/TatE family subunit [Candidatus Methanoperedens sp.]